MGIWKVIVSLLSGPVLIWIMLSDVDYKVPAAVYGVGIIAYFFQLVFVLFNHSPYKDEALVWMQEYFDNPSVNLFSSTLYGYYQGFRCAIKMCSVGGCAVGVRGGIVYKRDWQMSFFLKIMVFKKTSFKLTIYKEMKFLTAVRQTFSKEDLLGDWYDFSTNNRLMSEAYMSNKDVKSLIRGLFSRGCNKFGFDSKKITLEGKTIVKKEYQSTENISEVIESLLKLSTAIPSA